MRSTTTFLAVAISIICAVIVLNSCETDSSYEAETRLDTNLKLAKSNRAELESVLDHYAAANDTLGYQSAVFLIENMHNQFTVTCQRADWIAEQLQKTNGLNWREATAMYDSLYEQSGEDIPKCKKKQVPDLEIVSAELLISNIDLALQAWNRYSRDKSVSFQTFCEYILPYKSGTAQPELWRAEVWADYPELPAALDTCKTIVEMTRVVMGAVRPEFRYMNIRGKFVDFTYEQFESAKAGECYGWANMGNYVLRAFGIPATTMFAPQWGNHRSGHAWHGIAHGDDLFTAFASEIVRQGCFAIELRETKTAKVYSLGYSEQQHAIPSSYRGPNQSIPDKISDPRIIDVTGQHVVTSDLMISPDRPTASGDELMYLCLFSREDPEAVAWGELENDTAVFSHLGRDVVYLPSWYRKNQYEPAHYPIVLTFDGDTVQLKPDMSSWRNVTLYRKYPLKPSMFRYTRIFKGMRVQVSESADFETYDTVDTIARWPSPVITDRIRMRDRWNWADYGDSIVFDPPLQTQFIRLLAAPRQQFVIGEFAAIGADNLPLNAKAFGSKPGAHVVSDGLYGEAYTDTELEGWVALDLGSVQTISKIKFLPSNDSNSIQVGDNYELFYWDNEWISLGKQTATSKSLTYKVPSNALFFLKNLDRGFEERVFTLDSETGEQVWW